MKRFIEKIKQRNLYRAALAYLAASWLLVQILETVLPIFGFPETSIRWVVITLVIGFIPALTLSWVYAWPYAGGQASGAGESEAALSSPIPKRTDRIVITMLAMAVLLLSIDRFVFQPRSTVAANSIAVLPFTDMTARQDQGYFGDGLADELLNLLTHYPALRVAARTSSFRFRDSSVPVDEIADQLGVTHVLEGSVRRDGERIRVTAQLISAEDGFHVWSQTYEESVSDIFSIQDSIASQIATALESNMLGSEVLSRRTDPDAYALYLQAKYQSRIGSGDSLEQAVAYLQEALGIDASYAPAWAYLAHVYSNLAGQGFQEWERGFELAQDAAERAVETDPDYPDGYLQLAWIAHRYEGDLAKAVEYAQMGFGLRQASVDSLRSAAVLLLQIGRLDKAISILEYCTARSPLDSTGFYNLGVAYKYADQLVQAENTFLKVLRMNPEYNGAVYQLGETRLLLGRPAQALENWQGLEGYNLAKGTALALYDLNDLEGSNQALQQLITSWGDMWPSTVVDVLAYRGDIDGAFEWLEKDYEKFGAAGWGEMRQQRLFENLRDDPRWQQFLEKTGVSDAQLRSLDFEVHLPGL